MKWVIAILTVILRALLPALFEATKASAEDGATRPDLRNRLRARVRARWGKALALVLILALLPGCGTRTIYVADGEPVRLRETIRKAKVWVLDADGKPVAGRMDLPAGWFCLPDPGPEE